MCDRYLIDSVSASEQKPKLHGYRYGELVLFVLAEHEFIVVSQYRRYHSNFQK